MITFQKVVTTSGTPVQLPDNAVQDNETLIVKAKNANTGVIYVGNTGPNAGINQAICYRAGTSRI